MPSLIDLDHPFTALVDQSSTSESYDHYTQGQTAKEKVLVGKDILKGCMYTPI